MGVQAEEQANRRRLGACRAQLSLGCPGQGDGEGKAGKLVPETQYEKNIIVTNWIQEANTMHLLTLLARTELYRAVTNNH